MKHLLIVAATILPAWSAAFAQDVSTQTAPAPQQSSGYRVRVGAGAQFRPKFPGAGKNELAPLIHVSIARGNDLFRFSAPDDSLAIRIAKTGNFALGPAVNLAAGRRDSDVRVPLGRVKSTIEAGGFIDYNVGGSLRVRAEVRKGINGHKGVVGGFGIDRIWRDGDKYVFSVGPRVIFSDSRYQRAFFGVTPAASLASGLPVYRPRGGIQALAIASGFSYQFNDHIGMFDFVRYERLVADAAKSPIVRELGSPNQVSVGLGLSYTFRSGS